MKKSKWMRLAAILLVLCLMTTSFICGTFAKYISKDSAADTARVAKWGVVINAGGSLFSDAYWANEAAANPDMPTKWVEASIKDLSITVAAENGNAKDNVVAPGTKSAGSGMVIGLSGKPEVALELKGHIKTYDIGIKAGTWAYVTPIKLTEETYPLVLAQNDEVNSKIKHELWIKSSAEGKYVPASGDFVEADDYFLATVYTIDANYLPVKYVFSGSASSSNALLDIAKGISEKFEGEDIGGTVTIVDNPADPATFIANRDVTMSAKLPANTDLSAIGLCGTGGAPATLTWEWAFSDGDAADAGDTVLGNLMAMAKGDLPGGDNIIFDGSSVSVSSDGIMVTVGEDIIGCLVTCFDIELSATQID